MKPMQQLIAEADAVLSDVDAAMAIFDRMCEARLHQALADAAAACPECSPPETPAAYAARLHREADALWWRLCDARDAAWDARQYARAERISRIRGKVRERTWRRAQALERFAVCDTPPQPAPDARPVTPPTPPLAEAVQPADDPLPAIARLWGRLERGEIDGDRYLELLREGGWA